MTKVIGSAAEKIGALSKEKAALLHALLEEHLRDGNRIKQYPRIEREGRTRLPTAWAQQRLWFVDQLERGQAAYFIASAARLKGRLDREALQSALDALIRRHEALRTVFVVEDGEPRQEIAGWGRFELKVFDLGQIANAELEQQVLLHKNQEIRGKFDLEVGPLIRGRLLRLREEEHVLLVTMHHIVSDGWSMAVFFRELAELYRARRDGGEVQLGVLPIQYGDYAQWHRDWMSGERLQKHLAYWRHNLGDAPPEHELPTDRPRPAVQSYRGDNVRLDIDAQLGRDLRMLARRYETTLFSVLYAAWAILLSRLSGQEDILVGTPVANRQRPELEGLIGFFVNTVVLRVAVSSDCTLSDFLEHVKRVTRGAYDHHDVPFEQVVETLQPDRSLSRHPIFQIALALQNAPRSELRMPDLQVTLEDGGDEPAMFDILLSLEEREDRIAGVANYAADLFDRETISRWLESFKLLLKAFVQQGHERVGRLMMLPEGERHQVIDKFNDTRREYPGDKLVHELFEEWVARAPNAVAVVYEGQTVSYSELNAHANRLAHYLRDLGVAAGEYVPILIPRSLRMLVAQIAVLKSGAVYIPLDPELPAERLAFMISDCGARRVVIADGFQTRFENVSVHWIDYEQVLGTADHPPAENPAYDASRQAAAYVMYTSGSTGAPKGVIVPHRAINRLVIRNGYAEIGPADCVAHCSNPAFDASTFETWGALLNGARVLIVPQAVVLDAERFAEALKGSQVTALWLTVGLFSQYSDVLSTVFAQLRYLMVGGDVVDPTVIGRVMRRSPPQNLLNAYGPTECTTFSTTYRVETNSEHAKALPIGRPISNTQIYILDRYLQPVPVGVTGEIYIGGAGVALGYLNRPELTAERFLQDPFSADRQGRMYKSGDLGRWRADGNIEFLGRNDHQVKIRGYRIELGEIESRLLEHAQVKEAAVLAREDVPGDKRLVAYLAPRDDGELRLEELRAHLKTTMPEYMVPSAYVVVERFPLTANGKLDRRALPPPDVESYVSRQYEAPEGRVEEILAGIWQELLRMERVGRLDNFFELGGHSLLMVKMMDGLRRAGLSATVRDIYESPTLADLAQKLMDARAGNLEIPPNLIPPGCTAIKPEMLPLVELDQEQIERIVKAVPGGAHNIQDIYPLAPLQEGILFHHLLNEGGGDAYVVATLLSVSSDARLEELIVALQKVIDRHDALRTAVLWENLSRPVQVVYRTARLFVEKCDLAPGHDAVEQAREWIRPERQSLDLRHAPMLRLKVGAMPGSGQQFVLLQLHHIACDHVTAEIAISEAVAHLEGRASELPVPTPYRDHVVQALAHARAHDAEAFFRGKLSDVDEPTMPFGLSDVHGDGSDVIESEQILDTLLSRRLRAQARRLGLSAAPLIHAAWALVVARTAGRDDVVFGSVLLGRLQGSAGAQRTLGMFINTLPLRINLVGMTARELVERTQRELVELLDYEQASLAVAQRCSGVVGSAPLFCALLNYRHSERNPEGEWSSASGIRMLVVQDRTNYPITVSVDDLGDEFSITAQTDRRVDPNRMIGYMCTAICSLVEALECDSDGPVLKLSVLPSAERFQVVETFNATQTDKPKFCLVHELLEKQVLCSPHATAVEYEQASLTYAELNSQADRLAAYLRSRCVSSGDIVAICMDRGPDMVIGLIAILKAGAAYLPLDPSYPSERLRHMLDDATPRVLLTQRKVVNALPEVDAVALVIEDEGTEILGVADRNPMPACQGLNGDSLVYVIYTSGSTGKPKGTAMSHGSMVNLIEWHRQTFCDSERRRVLQFAALSFDVAFQEIFSTLCTGGTLVLIDDWIRKDARELSAFLGDRSIDRLFIPPMMLQGLAEHCRMEGVDLPRLRDVITAGEQLRISPEIASFFKRSGRRLHNHYGPTETHVVTALTMGGDSDLWPTLPAIGRPITNTRIYVLNTRNDLAPIDVAGEIYVGGAGVARGYLDRPDLTAQRFVVDPLRPESNERVYRTGDLGRWRADGTLEYLGRNDDQVKIRGFRIELGEVEAHLVRHRQVKSAAVIAREDEPGEKRLVAYVTCSTEVEPSVEELRAHLKQILPDHMLPSAFVTLESLPVLPNGKLDRRNLPAPDAGAYTRRHYEAPQGEVEEILAGVWSDLLRVERISRNDNFFELGGHSLLIVQMMERLRRGGLSANVRRIYESATLADLAQIIAHEGGSSYEVPPNRIPAGCEAITPEMLSLIDLNAEHIEAIARMVPGGIANIQDIYPLAPLQGGILFHHLLDEQGGDTYVLPTVLCASDRSKLDAFVEALKHVIRRHEALRTAVLWEGLPQPVQVVYRDAQLPVEEMELNPHQDAIEQLKDMMLLEHQKLDLRRAPMMRVRLAKDLRGDHWYVLLQMHHIACDHESLDHMFSEVTAYLLGSTDRQPLSGPYRNHVAHALNQARVHDSESFFRRKLGDVSEPTAPFGLMKLSSNGNRIDQAQMPLDAALARRLRGQARCCAVSAATLFHAAWALVLARTCGRDDVVFGSVLLGRMHGSSGGQRTLGMFINTLPLRLKMHGSTVREVVRQTQRELIELLHNEQASLAVVQRCSGLSGSTPLFTALLNYRHSAVDIDGALAIAGVSFIANQSWTNYPLMLAVDDMGDEFLLTVKVDDSVDANRVMAYVTTTLGSLVEALESGMEVLATALQVLPASEYQQVVEEFNATSASYPECKLLHELFEDQVCRSPHDAAIRYDGCTISYEEVNCRANRLAHFLRRHGVSRGHRVGILVDRSAETIVGILGTLKSGAAYVPLDPTFPPDRLAYLVEDAQLNVVLTRGRFGDCLRHARTTAVCLDDVIDDVASERAENPSPESLSPEDLAYVIYTSGSTGSPKGVMIRHRSVVNYAAHVARQFDVAGGDGSFVATSLSFDLSLTGVYPVLLCGRAITLCGEAEDLSQGLLRGRNYAPVKLTPSHLGMLVSEQAARRVHTLVLGGEPLQASALRWWRDHSPDTRIFNHYGPTEATIGCVIYEVPDTTLDGVVPIGRPISNTQIHILDKYLQPVPVGVTGEIYIGGAGVALGYLNRPELTAERFLRDPFSADRQGRMYKSGDLGRWRADGNIEFLGRNDHQVKIRGYRIELGEIESSLLQHARVKEATVLAREDMPGDKRLVAYLTQRDNDALSIEELRVHLKATMPEYMVPSAYVVLERFPLTANGKLDRGALPPPDVDSYVSRQYEKPEGRVEGILAGIWQELLRVERVGRLDNFFELGGHSLLMVKMMEGLRRAGLSATVRSIYESPTLADLAQELTDAQAGNFEIPPNLIPPGCTAIKPEMVPLVELDQAQIERIVKAVPGGAQNIQDIYPLTPLQEGMLFHSLLHHEADDTYLATSLLSVSSRAQIEKLAAALQIVIDRHDALRTAILWEHLPRPVQVVCRTARLLVSEVVLDPRIDPAEQMRRRVTAVEEWIDLRQPPQMRLHVAADPLGERWYGMLQLHHITSDNTSQSIVLSELAACLEGRAQQLNPVTPYRNHIAHVLSQTEANDAESFFKSKLGTIDETTAPFGLTDVRGDGGRILEARRDLEPSVSRKLLAFARRLGVSAATLFHAGWALVVSRTSGRDEVVYGTVLLGRLQGAAGGQKVIGMFINTLPLRLRLHESTVEGLVYQAHHELAELLNHEQTSLPTAQRCSAVPSGVPLFSSLLNYSHGTQEVESQFATSSGVTVVESRSSTNYPFVLSVRAEEENFTLTAQTDRRVPPDRVIEYASNAIRALVDALETAPLMSASKLEIVSECERYQVTKKFNATSREYPRNKLVHEVFEEQVAKVPDAVAVVFEECSLTYTELNDRANRLAHYLRRQDVQSGEYVPILLPRCLQMLVAQLAVLKCGAVYVPLDSKLPVERQAFIVRDCGARVVFSEHSAYEALGHLPVRWIDCAEVEDTIGRMPVHNLSSHINELSTAYVMYTSGSTGVPKGVMIPHRAVNRLAINNAYAQLGPSDCVAHCSNPAFDASTFEIWGALLNGARVLIVPQSLALDTSSFFELLCKHRVTVLFQTTALFNQRALTVPKLFSRLRYVLFGGELADANAVRGVLSNGRPEHLLHLYGPTEATTFTTCYEVTDVEADETSIPIGKPIANTQVYILDQQLRPVPVGVTGEIYVGGPGVALGYLNRPELTAERFIDDPFNSDAGARLYRSGDLGRWRPDGNIEFLGRNDQQVKVRGFRVEPGEIEAALARHEEVSESRVVLREVTPGDRRLVAYVTQRGEYGLNAETLSAHLRTMLPEYMIPAAFVFLEDFPLTPNGKIDLRVLPIPESGVRASERYEEPKGEVEEILAGIWQEVLHVERIGRNDNFFELGGHSLHGVRLISLVAERLTVRLPVVSAFQYPTLVEMANAVRVRLRNETDSTVSVDADFEEGRI